MSTLYCIDIAYMFIHGIYLHILYIFIVYIDRYLKYSSFSC